MTHRCGALIGPLQCGGGGSRSCHWERKGERDRERESLVELQVNGCLSTGSFPSWHTNEQIHWLLELQLNTAVCVREKESVCERVRRTHSPFDELDPRFHTSNFFFFQTFRFIFQHPGWSPTKEVRSVHARACVSCRVCVCVCVWMGFCCTSVMIVAWFSVWARETQMSPDSRLS